MKLHTDTLTHRDIYQAANLAGVDVEQIVGRGSRSHKGAFDVLISGSSSRNAQRQTFKAATWDEWGIFLSALFDIDPDMMAGNKSWGYRDKEDFKDRTYNRFVNGRPDDYHAQHKWHYDGHEGQHCTKCSAQFRFWNA